MPAARPAQARSLHILLAEDNRTNQTVATRMLRKMGHSTVVAGNGKEALLLLTTHRFDLVLMDIQMPEMDGLIGHQENPRERERDATAPANYCHDGSRDEGRSRALYRSRDGRICLQANQQPGGRRSHCRHRRACRVKARLSSAWKLNRRMPELPTAPSRIVWNMGETLERLGGDEKLFHEVIEIFLDDVPKHMASLRRAIAAGDAEAVEGAAHTLKGELGYLGISEVSQKARELEEFGRNSDLRFAADLYATLGIGAFRTVDLDARHDGRQSRRGDGCRIAGPSE